MAPSIGTNIDNNLMNDLKRTFGFTNVSARANLLTINGVTITVENGDTLFTISQKFKNITRFNKYKDEKISSLQQFVKACQEKVKNACKAFDEAWRTIHKTHKDKVDFNKSKGVYSYIQLSGDDYIKGRKLAEDECKAHSWKNREMSTIQQNTNSVISACSSIRSYLG